jgi:hypothetical protein
MKEKFPYLLIISKILEVTAWLCLAAGFIVFLLILWANLDVGVLGMKVEAKGGWGLFSSLYYLSYGAIAFLVFNGGAELVKLFISVEENLRKKS